MSILLQYKMYKAKKINKTNNTISMNMKISIMYNKKRHNSYSASSIEHKNFKEVWFKVRKDYYSFCSHSSRHSWRIAPISRNHLSYLLRKYNKNSTSY